MLCSSTDCSQYRHIGCHSDHVEQARGVEVARRRLICRGSPNAIAPPLRPSLRFCDHQLEGIGVEFV
jgi:hypothetical protein